MNRFCFAWQPWKALAFVALLLCCVLGPHPATAADGDVSAPTPQSETMKFLQALVTAVPDLKQYADGADYCDWRNFVQCVKGVATKVKLTGLKLTQASSLPDLADGVNGTLVTVTGFEANDIGAMLSGTLPPSWGRLTQMQRIVLSGNALTGSLPAEWSGMTSLMWVYVDGNSLTGELPKSWSSFSLMMAVYAASNRLTGVLPSEWSGMTMLGTLALSNNKLSGTLPAAWSSLRTLSWLELNNNSLSGPLPAEWSKLHMSKGNLLLQDNNFCGCVPPEWAGSLTPTVDPAVSADSCATTNVCVTASSSGAGPHSSSHSKPTPSPASSSHSSPSPSPASSSHSKPSPVVASSSSSSSFECAVVHCLECEAGNSTKCSQCARRYALTDDSQCASKGDAAYRQSLGNRNGWLMLALLCTCVLWNLV